LGDSRRADTDQELANRMIVRNPGVLVADWDGQSRSFHTILGKVCAITIPFHVLVAPSIYLGIPERGRSEGDSFGNRRDLKISIIRAIYTLVPSRFSSGNEEK
jgi:hypothetical protein